MKQTGHIQTGCFFADNLLSYLQKEIKKDNSQRSPSKKGDH